MMTTEHLPFRLQRMKILRPEFDVQLLGYSTLWLGNDHSDVAGERVPN